jgi:hypothetical protein
MGNSFLLVKPIHIDGYPTPAWIADTQNDLNTLGITGARARPLCALARKTGSVRIMQKARLELSLTTPDFILAFL